MANIPARVCDPFLPGKIRQIGAGATASALVKLIHAKRERPSKSTIEQMHAETRLFQERSVIEVAEILNAIWKETAGDPQMPDLPNEICSFDRCVFGIGDAYAAIGREHRLIEDAIDSLIAERIECRKEHVALVREQVPMPFAFCQSVVKAMSVWPHCGVRLADIIRSSSDQVGAVTENPALYQAFLNHLYPGREENFWEKKSPPVNATQSKATTRKPHAEPFGSVRAMSKNAIA